MFAIGGVVIAMGIVKYAEERLLLVLIGLAVCWLAVCFAWAQWFLPGKCWPAGRGFILSSGLVSLFLGLSLIAEAVPPWRLPGSILGLLAGAGCLEWSGLIAFLLYWKKYRSSG